MDMVPDLACPLLALFGVEDENPTAEQAEQMKALLDQHGKTYEWVMYNNAGHAFFADYRPSYRAAPAQDMWHRVWHRVRVDLLFPAKARIRTASETVGF